MCYNNVNIPFISYIIIILGSINISTLEKPKGLTPYGTPLVNNLNLFIDNQ